MMSRPITPGILFESIPAELRALPHWVLWRFERRFGRWTKVPHSASTGRRASSTDAGTWAPFEVAVAALRRGGRRWDGIGFVISEGDPFVGVDIDGCIDPDSGEIAVWALALVRHLHSYTELSPSGRGIKIWVRGSLPPAARHKRSGLGPGGTGSVEIYDRSRFFTVTGRQLEGFGDD
jgi:primase-polymerase (primpol)-like protein